MSEIDLKSLLPLEDETVQVRPTGETLYFARERLIDYIDGGAELYFAYGFQDMVAREYELAGGSTATVEIYRMDGSENAYGVYSFDTRGSHPDIGQEATYGAGLLKFWQGRFFVRIYGQRAGTEIERALIEVGKGIAKRIGEWGVKPAIVGCIPGSNVIPESVQFFHKQICLNNIYYIADENLLCLGEDTDAISYQYRINGSSARVIVVRYSGDIGASTAFDNFVRRYLERDVTATKLKPILTQRIENGTWCAIRRIRNVMVLVFDAPDEEACRCAIEGASSNVDQDCLT